MEFEWEEKKRALNLLKHRLDFADAPLLIAVPHLMEPTHPGTDAARFRVIGRVGSLYLTLIFTPRGEAWRIMSFRRARDGERRRHQALHG